jgi:hypothetical protein
MNETVNDDPMGGDYWDTFERRERRVTSERNARDGLYGGSDPATWGWRRPDPAELQAERIAGLERAVAERVTQE